MLVRSQGQPISCPLICEKALEMNSKLWANADFKGKQLLSDTEAAEHFKESFKNMINLEGFNETNVYNSDKTGLYLKKFQQNH
ncbi:hypothetical protein PR048_005347 [Dryococelus australis]|uniref:Uncharacterized protein n=1 Tax=Dryococelus australis TaxID=614101 RepID=A0ABQ9I813_9NEOP|nr:hypothetical protein PR048_005347 [Dryococelus australis]